MRTDDLISVLAVDHGRVNSAWLRRATALISLSALAVTVLSVIATLGARRDIASALMTVPVLAKLAFGGSLAAIALVVFQRSLRPGLRLGRALWWALLPVGLAGGWALATLAQAPFESWSVLTFGRNWRTCLIAVPLYSLLPFLLLLALARQGAPVDRRLTGASAGLASGGLAIIGYGLHCPDDTAPFLAVWYSLAVAIVTTFTTLAAPRWLRW
jgi:hypothetical protein